MFSFNWLCILQHKDTSAVYALFSLVVQQLTCTLNSLVHIHHQANPAMLLFADNGRIRCGIHATLGEIGGM